MGRWDRLKLWHTPEPPPARTEVSAASAISCLYRHWRIAGAELERLARGLNRQRFDESLRSLERACASVRIAGELVEVIERVQSEHSGFTMAEGLRRDLLAEILPWLEAARKELPAATSILCSVAPTAASRDAALAALGQLDGTRAPRRQRTGS